MKRGEYHSQWFPESEWLERNLKRLLQIENEDYRRAYLHGVNVARGPFAAQLLQSAYDNATALEPAR